MKTKIWLVSLSMIFSSCYNYKHLDLHSDHLAPGDYYELTTASDHTWKGRVLQVTDSIVTLRKGTGQQIDFPLAQLSNVQRRKLAVGKTIGLSATLLGTTLGVIAFAILSTPSNIDWGSFYIQGLSNK
jgi:hypothetical protein